MFTIQSIHISLEIWGCLFCCITSLCLYLSKNFEKKRRTILVLLQLSTAFLLFMDALAWDFRGYPGEKGAILVRVSNFFVFFISDVIFFLFHTYVCNRIFEDGIRKRKDLPVQVMLNYIISILGMILVIISQFTHWYYYFDANNFYHRNWLYPLCLIIGIIGILIDFSLLIQYRKKIKKGIFLSMLSYIILPFIANIILLFFYGISLLNIAITISALFIFVMAIIEQGQQLSEREKQLYDTRLTMMFSQIGPHFIYNTLTTIRYLCDQDPKIAAETVDEFALYLRGNLETLTKLNKIPFEEELKHVKNYLLIEKKRFRDRIKVVYDLQEMDFNLPPLTLQLLVENAITHGIMKRPQGGSIWISSKKEAKYIVLIVEDDGIGFDYKKILNDGKTHVGIENVTKRIKLLMKGEIQIESTCGKGTRVTVRIPQLGEGKDEYFSSR